MKKKRTAVICAAVIAAAMAGCAKQDAPGADCAKIYGSGPLMVRIATGSPGELGLLEKLADEFARRSACSVCWIKAGSGKSLDLLGSDRADLVMVHDPEGEKKALNEGRATGSIYIGSNEFFIAGPVKDPAGIAAAKSAQEAFRKIAQREAPFLSRGDRSGTHRKELAIWKRAGVKPSGKWYRITGGFMTASLREADRTGAYFMTDSSTWITVRKELKNLRVLFRGDPVLVNRYHALCNEKTGTKRSAMGCRFAAFLASEKGQSIIRNFGRDLYGEPLYSDAVSPGHGDR